MQRSDTFLPQSLVTIAYIDAIIKLAFDFTYSSYPNHPKHKLILREQAAKINLVCCF